MKGNVFLTVLSLASGGRRMERARKTIAETRAAQLTIFMKSISGAPNVHGTRDSQVSCGPVTVCVRSKSSKARAKSETAS